IVTASDPRFAAGAHQVRKGAPGIRSQLVAARYRLKFPELFAGLRVVGANETALRSELRASHETLDDFSVDHERPAGVAVAFLRIGDARLPDDFAATGIERV